VPTATKASALTPNITRLATVLHSDPPPGNLRGGLAS
jgi:hypothetical protein